MQRTASLLEEEEDFSVKFLVTLEHPQCWVLTVMLSGLVCDVSPINPVIGAWLSPLIGAPVQATYLDQAFRQTGKVCRPANTGSALQLVQLFT